MRAFSISIYLFFKKKEENKQGKDEGRAPQKVLQIVGFWAETVGFCGCSGGRFLSDIKGLREKRPCNHGEISLPATPAGYFCAASGKSPLDVSPPW